MGGVLLILFAWLVYRFTRPKEMIRKARRRLREREGEEETNGNQTNWKQKIQSIEG